MEYKIISHRGNLNGSIPETENSYRSIISAINLGLDVEIDVWRVNKILYLCHDLDMTKTNNTITKFLIDNASKLWIHCKNIDALEYLLDFDELNVFGHSNDEFVLTSKHYIFCRPGVVANKKSIIVMPEMNPIYTEETLKNCYGILTDYPLDIQNKNFTKFVT
jgi:hypothetical protein